jgi:hypothetical protein
MKLDKYFLLTWRKLWVMVVSGFVAILIHNFWYAIFKFEEAVFFIYVVIVLPIYFLICILYTFFKKVKDGSILNRKFLMRSIWALIIGAIVGYGFIYFDLVNFPLFYVLFLVFSFIAYYLIKFKGEHCSVYPKLRRRG